MERQDLNKLHCCMSSAMLHAIVSQCIEYRPLAKTAIVRHTEGIESDSQRIDLRSLSHEEASCFMGNGFVNMD